MDCLRRPKVDDLVILDGGGLDAGDGDLFLREVASDMANAFWVGFLSRRDDLTCGNSS